MVLQQEYEKATQALMAFIEKSPTSFHAVENTSDKLNEAGYCELLETEKWEFSQGGKYYVTRNDSAIIAFTLPKTTFKSFSMIAAHTDSPSFKLKANGEIDFEKHYTKLNVEGYGGMLCAPWFDRPLSIAGRIMLKEKEGISSRCFNFERDLVSIVNPAIHMNRQANEGYTFKKQKDMLPIFSGGSEARTVKQLVAEELKVEETALLDMDLFLYNRMPGTIWGADRSFYSSPRIDDLQCAYSALTALTTSENEQAVMVMALFDNEEVGSGTRQGALGNFLESVLKRINASDGGNEESYYQRLAESFMVSADNGHAVHPNYPEYADPTTHPYVNGGVLIKYSANQKYTTDAVSSAIFKEILKQKDIPFQEFVNHSDIAGGSTLGNLSNQHVSVNTLDIGVAQLAMHSPYETGGIRDTKQLIDAMKAFYNTRIEKKSRYDYKIVTGC